jgi:hypothetical protein
MFSAGPLLSLLLFRNLNSTPKRLKSKFNLSPSLEEALLTIEQIKSLIIEFLKSKDWVTQAEIDDFIQANSSLDINEASDLIHNLLQFKLMEREPLAFVDGGFVYSSPSVSLDKIKDIVIEFITCRLKQDLMVTVSPDAGILVGDKIVMIIPEIIRTSNIQDVFHDVAERLAHHAEQIGKCYALVRGSVAAAKLREMFQESEDSDVLDAVPMYRSSMEALVESLNTR